MAALFAFFVVCSSFGIGNMTQANSISAALSSSYGVPDWMTGAIVMVLALCVLVRGIHSIGKVSSVIVPAMAAFYFVAASIALLILCGL